MNDHGVAQGARSQDLTGGQFPLTHRFQSSGRADAQFIPDRFAAWRKGRMRKGQAKGFADDLRSGGGPKKLTSSAGAGASVAQFFRCLIQADLAVGKTNAQGLGFACVLAFLAESVTPPGKRMEGSSGKLAKVIIIAGMLLSQVATPIRARAVGSERTSLRA